MIEPRVLIVTGGSRGIGRAIVKGAIRDGYAVCFNYASNSAAASELMREVNGIGRIIAIRGDVADPAFAAKAFAEAEAALGPVTDLVNNAGITGPIGPFVDATEETMRRVLDVNILGTMFCAREAARHWQAGKIAGVMVNVSSVAATLGAPNEYVHYAASKAAIEGFTIGLAKELAPTGIRVNAVSPGTAFTDIHATAGEPDRPKRIAPRVPLGRVAQPEEIAEAVLWLLSPKASYVTGTVLRATGGL